MAWKAVAMSAETPTHCGAPDCPVPLRLLWPVKDIRLTVLAGIYRCWPGGVEHRARRAGLWDLRPHRRAKRPAEAGFRALWADATLSNADIAARCGMSRDMVTFHGRSLGLPRRRSGRRSQFGFDATFDAMWRAGVLAREIARAYGCSARLVPHTAAQRGLPARGRFAGVVVTLADFRALQLRLSMAADAARTRDALRDLARQRVAA
jgi:hypothetical protein